MKAITPRVIQVGSHHTKGDPGRLTKDKRSNIIHHHTKGDPGRKESISKTIRISRHTKGDPGRKEIIGKTVRETRLKAITPRVLRVGRKVLAKYKRNN